MYFVGDKFEPQDGGYKTILQAKKQAEKKNMKVYNEEGVQVYPEAEKTEVTGIEVTDETPENTPQEAENEKSGVNVYNEAGEVVAAMTEEEAEQLEAEAAELHERGAIGTVIVVRDGLLALRNKPNWGSGYKCGIAKTGYTARAIGRVKAPEGDFYKLENGRYISARPEDTKLVEE